MADDKKPALDLVIEGEPKSKGPKGMDDMTTEEDEGEGDLDAAAGEMFDMLKTDDREGFVQAVKAMKMCS